MSRKVFIASALAGVALTVGGLPASSQEMKDGGTFGEWSLLTDGKSPPVFCFVTSEPKTSTPKGASRDAPRAYISAWPKDGIKGEVSFRLGFPIKTSTDSVAAIDATTFKLFGADGRAFVADATQELKLVEAMKKGDELKVAVTSERGTLVTDTYSLTGIGQALQKLQDTCFKK